MRQRTKGMRPVSSSWLGLFYQASRGGAGLLPPHPERGVCQLGSHNSGRDLGQCGELARGHCDAKKVMLPMQAGDVWATFADPSLLRAPTGYAARTSVEVASRRS